MYIGMFTWNEFEIDRSIYLSLSISFCLCEDMKDKERGFDGKDGERGNIMFVTIFYILFWILLIFF